MEWIKLNKDTQLKTGRYIVAYNDVDGDSEELMYEYKYFLNKGDTVYDELLMRCKDNLNRMEAEEYSWQDSLIHAITTDAAHRKIFESGWYTNGYLGDYQTFKKDSMSWSYRYAMHMPEAPDGHKVCDPYIVEVGDE